jgi:hypothetical protein
MILEYGDSPVNIMESGKQSVFKAKRILIFTRSSLKNPPYAKACGLAYLLRFKPSPYGRTSYAPLGGC